VTTAPLTCPYSTGSCARWLSLTGRDSFGSHLAIQRPSTACGSGDKRSDTCRQSVPQGVGAPGGPLALFVGGVLDGFIDGIRCHSYTIGVVVPDERGGQETAAKKGDSMFWPVS
jgi:hypothetical protein